MKPDRIKVSQEFPGLWLSVDIPIAPEENIIEEFKKGRSLLVDAYNSSNGSNQPPDSVPVVHVEKPTVNRAEILIKDIEACTTLDGLSGLNSWRKIVEASPELQSAFDRTKDKIVAGEVKSILDRTEQLNNNKEAKQLLKKK